MTIRAAIAAAVALLALAPPALADDAAGLVRTLREDPAPRVRGQAALALGPRGADPAVRDALVGALRDDDAVVRASAAKALLDACPLQAWDPAAQAALDPDALVSKWSSRLVRRIAGRAAAVTIDLAGVHARFGPRRSGDTKAFQEAVLEVLVRQGRFAPATSFDFSEDAAPAAVADAIRVEVTGEASVDALDGPTATVTVTLQALVPSCGFPLASASATAVGRPPHAPADPDADEYSVRPQPEDPRLAGLRAAARAAALDLARALSRPDDAAPEVRVGATKKGR